MARLLQLTASLSADDVTATEVVKLTGNTPTEGQLNLADDPKYAEKRKEMEALLYREMVRLDDPYRLWDQTPIQGKDAVK